MGRTLISGGFGRRMDDLHSPSYCGRIILRRRVCPVPVVVKGHSCPDPGRKGDAHRRGTRRAPGIAPGPLKNEYLFAIDTDESFFQVQGFLHSAHCRSEAGPAAARSQTRPGSKSAVVPSSSKCENGAALRPLPLSEPPRTAKSFIGQAQVGKSRRRKGSTHLRMANIISSRLL